MREDNLELGSKFAKNFNKKYGIITYSGTLAIEIALHSLKLNEDSKILVSSNVCYSIINTILKLKLKPIIVIPDNQLFLTEKDIDTVLNYHQIDCIMLVHQYGILNDINPLKYHNKNIKIIEDVAQCWNINSYSHSVGSDSDIVVTSFGKTKPLSYGIGGGLFFNNPNIINEVDFSDNISREESNLILSYSYPLCSDIDYKKLVISAEKIVKEQRQNVNQYYEILNNQKLFSYISYNDKINNVWHRFPIWIDDKGCYLKVVKELQKTELEYQLPHKIDLKDLPLCKYSLIVDNSKFNKNFILLRTRNINMKKQIAILLEIINKFS